MKTGWGILNVFWNISNKDTCPLPGTRNGLSRKMLVLWSQPHGDGSESTTRLMLGRRCLQIGPDNLKSVCSVVGHFLLSVELSFQLGNMKRCLDAVADGLQPSYFSSCP